MTALEESKTIATLAAVKDYMLLRRVSWDTYRELLEAWGPRAPRHTYDRGSLEILAKSSIHEIFKSVIGLLLALLCDETGRDFVAGGETTLAKEDVDRGIEPDQCYWIANANRVEGKLDIDFEVEPVPDLFIEVEVSRTVLDRIAVLAALGVSEVWRFDGEKIHVGLLQGDGTYAWKYHSPTFPEMELDDLVRFVKQTRSLSHLKIIRAFRTWVPQQVKKS
jgi:Uma2 family endonuclease